MSPDADFVALQMALAGEFSLDREIGRGGMGVVYLAREVRLARPVAIKVLPPTLAQQPALRDAFLRESQTVARLNHPNIVPIHSAGERGGFVYLAMAYVEGITLGERIRSRGPLLPGQAARVLREVAWALAYAHSAGIVHRDVSAENIMLERGSERAIVMDFGIASAMQASATDADGQVMGNAYYVSPEHAAGEPLDARSDLYSLGVVGFYALTGRFPFEGESSAQIVTQHLASPAPSITSVAGSVPPRLAAAVERCLHKAPSRRYASAENFAEAIDLAFEHAKEIPAPLRSWINQGERELPARLAMLGMGAIGGVAVSFAFQTPWAFLVPFGLLSTLSFVPTVSRLRRILSEGYHVDDLHAAMREHQLVRSEELEYERRQGSPRIRKVLRVVLGASMGGSALGFWAAYQTTQFVTGFTTRLPPESRVLAEALGLTSSALVFFSLLGVTVSAVPLAGEFIRHHLASRVASASISFWKGKWGSRIARLVGIGLKPAERPMLGMPVLTEIALGRATDHLFQALPKSARRELAALPETVRRLEGDASRLRESITALDDQLAAFERGGDAIRGDAGHLLQDDVLAARALASDRLVATVSALESIRLDLLRLQMGSAPIESVTATLDSAREIGDRIGESIAAHADVERLLARAVAPVVIPSERDVIPSEPVVIPSEVEGSAPFVIDPDDDADTPVSGVPAARG